MSVKEDPIKLHKEAMALMENKQFSEARDLFVKVAELYHKGQNYFGSAEMNYKAAHLLVLTTKISIPINLQKYYSFL